MKKSIKISVLILASALFVLAGQFSAMAATDVNSTDAGLTAAQVMGGLALLLAIIIFPISKAFKKTAIHQKA